MCDYKIQSVGKLVDWLTLTGLRQRAALEFLPPNLITPHIPCVTARSDPGATGYRSANMRMALYQKVISSSLQVLSFVISKGFHQESLFSTNRYYPTPFISVVSLCFWDAVLVKTRLDQLPSSLCSFVHLITDSECCSHICRRCTPQRDKVCQH